MNLVNTEEQKVVVESDRIITTVSDTMTTETTKKIENPLETATDHSNIVKAKANECCRCINDADFIVAQRAIEEQEEMQKRWVFHIKDHVNRNLHPCTNTREKRKNIQ